MACSPGCKKGTVFTLGTVLLLGGILSGLFWSDVTDYIYRSQLSLTPTSKGFDMWKETPIPMFFDVYFFNWTNPQETKAGAKPHFEEVGPYSFRERHTRVNISWNPENDTITFRQIRDWHFIPSKSHGPLEDEITTLNVIAATVASKMKNQNEIIRRIVSAVIDTEESFWVKKTVRELLFDGYKDPFLDIASKIKKFVNITIPFDKFGYFYARNLSSTYDGTWNMYTGQRNMSNLGYVNSWNDCTHTPYYDGHCGDVFGTTGEILPPLGGVNNLPVFASDLCSTLALTRSGQMVEKYGIAGPRFRGDAREFDNGTLYPDFKCFSTKDNIMPSGIRDVSKCRFGAPAYVSFPHFYLADPVYVNAVSGLNPQKQKHEFYIDVEENTGLPLEVRAQLQINMLMEPVKGIKMFEKVRRVVMPIFFFRQYVSLTPELASQVKLLLNLSNIGTFTFYGIAVIGAVLLMIGIGVTIRGSWGENDDRQLLLSTSDAAPKQENGIVDRNE